MADGAGDLDELQLWVRQAREAAGRQALATAGVPLQVATSLPGIVASWETSRSVHERRMLLSLRALRNLCVGLPLAQDQAHQAGLAVTLARLCELEPSGVIVEAALQALGNSCVRHAGSQESTWAHFFPGFFTRVAALRGEDALLAHGPLCMILLTCVKNDEARSLALAESPALLAELLEARAAVQQPADEQEDADQWLRLLMAHLCFDSRRLGPVYEALCRPGGTTSSNEPVVTVSHGAMFHLLADAVDLAAVQGQQDDDGVEQDTPYFLGIEALDVVIKALGDAARGWARSPDVGCGSTVQGALQLFRACASHDGALPECGEVGTAILLLLNLLSALGDPPGLRAGFRPASETPAPPPARLIAQEHADLPSRGVYNGYRRDLVAALANACHRRAHVVGTFVSSDHIATVLHQCRGDDEDTFTREWALFAVRNMCEISSEAQVAIRSLEAQTGPVLT